MTVPVVKFGNEFHDIHRGTQPARAWMEDRTYFDCKVGQTILFLDRKHQPIPDFQLVFDGQLENELAIKIRFELAPYSVHRRYSGVVLRPSIIQLLW